MKRHSSGKLWSNTAKLILFRPRQSIVSTLAFMAFSFMPIFSGYFLRNGFRALESGDTSEVTRSALLFAVSEVIGAASIVLAIYYFPTMFVGIQTLLRGNMLRSQVANGGPDAAKPVESAGDAITHFRDDTEDVSYFFDSWIDVAAGVAFSLVAAIILSRINLGATLLLAIPFTAVVVVTLLLGGQIEKYRRADREASAEITSSLNDVLSAAVSVRVNGATDNVLTHLEDVFAVRKDTAVRDRVLEDGLMAFGRGSSEIGLALVLLATAGAVASGSFGVGEFAIFINYLGWFSFLPRMLARLVRTSRQAKVSYDGMANIMDDPTKSKAVVNRFLPIESPDLVVAPKPTERVELDSLSVRNLGALHSDGGGFSDVSFDIKRGSLTVVTGPIGSGKSTLLRAILGLSFETTQSGEVHWNGELVADRAAFFVPPQSAYLAQVPELISESILNNIGFGMASDEQVRRAIETVAFSEDIDALPNGIETMVGSRGVRLSGGQRQRLAAARALVNAPELIVLDDLSSALDVETELELWTNLAAAGATVLAVSNRPLAIERADQLVELKANPGRAIS